jgi:hypothetical protein
MRMNSFSECRSLLDDDLLLIVVALDKGVFPAA